jgi:hypothetical protein
MRRDDLVGWELVSGGGFPLLLPPPAAATATAAHSHTTSAAVAATWHPAAHLHTKSRILLRKVTGLWSTNFKLDTTSVGDPDPHPDLDPYVLGPPGSASGAVSHKYGSGSGSGFGSSHHQTTIVRKALIFSMLWLLYDFLPVFRIRIHIRIRRFLGIPDPHPDPLVRGTDPTIRIRIRSRTKISRIANNGSNISANINSDPDHNLTLKLEFVDFLNFLLLLSTHDELTKNSKFLWSDKNRVKAVYFGHKL